jgi:hypothetical protein
MTLRMMMPMMTTAAIRAMTAMAGMTIGLR